MDGEEEEGSLCVICQRLNAAFVSSSFSFQQGNQNVIYLNP